MLNINPKKYKSKNFVSEKEMIKIVKNLQKEGKKVGLCTGSFDLLHPGHITHLIASKKYCDILIVGVAEDDFKRNKFPGSGRPLFSEIIRAFIVSQLKPVDYVYLDDGSIKSIKRIKPDIYIKGVDYIDLKDPGVILAKNMMASWGGKTIITKTEKLSTTNILKHIKEKIKI